MERVVSAVNNDELRTGDAMMEHLRMVERHLVVRGGDDERK